MALVKITDILKKAEQGGYAIGYFEAWDTIVFQIITIFMSKLCKI